MPQVRVDNNTDLSIPDDDSGGLVVTYDVAEATRVLGVRWSCYIEHTYPGDLTIELQHPDGTKVMLFDNVGGAGTGLGTSSADPDRMLITDEHPQSQTVNDWNTPPFVGRFASGHYTIGGYISDMQDAFAGKDGTGTWTLKITDTSGGDTGTHHASSLIVVIDTGVPGLEWHVTGLWDAAAVADGAVDYYGRIADPVEGEVTIPLNDSRLASVTLSKHDPLISAVQGHTYARCLKAYYHKQLVFWGPIKLIEYGLEAQDAGTVKLSAVDPSLRLIRQVLVRGDDALVDGDTGQISVDHVGLRLLRDAALNTAAQNAEGDPDIGIVNGTNDFTAAPGTLIGVQRGQGIWEAWLALTEAASAPDFSLPPDEDTVGAYCRLNTYTRKGSDKSASVVFHYGTGKQNLAGLSFTEGEEYTTHVHVLDRDTKYRFTEVNLDAAADTGPYVTWDATEFDAKSISAAVVEDVLRAYGEEYLDAYSRPLVTCSLTLPEETADSYIYGFDYEEGDTVGVAGRDGLIEMEEAAYRITQVVLRQANTDNAVRPEIQTVPDRVTAAGDIVGSGGPGS